MGKPALNRFGKFLISPYFNKNSALTILGNELISTVKIGKQPLSKQAYWALVRKNEDSYNDLKFRKLCNDLLERFERFLIVEQLGKDPLQQSNLLLSSIKQNQFKELAEKHISKSSKTIDRQMDQSAEFYLQKHFYNKALYNLKTDYEMKANMTQTLSKLTYKDLDENLDAFYVIEKLRNAIHILFWQRIFKTEIKLDLGCTLEIISKFKLDIIPAVKVYYYIYLLMTEEASDEIFFELKKIAKESIEYFPKNERREVLDALLTYCITDGNKGGVSFYDELLLLYDWGINSEILLENQHLTPTTFRNYVLAGLRFGAFDKVEKFIDNRAELLEITHRENAVNFNLARVMFYKKDYDSVIVYLNKVNYHDVFYAIDSKILLLATYYEKSEFDALESTIDAFIRFLQREKSLDPQKTHAYLNFCKFLKRFIQFKVIDFENFIEKIKATSPLYNKKWLIQKVLEHQA